jgi:hypothetical protein
MGQGELFALTLEMAQRLLACADESEVIDLVSAIEEMWEAGRRLPCWKEWPEIHQCLTGSRRDPRAGLSPLNKCLLGGCQLLDPDGGYMAVLLPPAEVPAVAAALTDVDGAWLQQRYLALFAEGGSPLIPEAQLQHLAALFDEIRGFYCNAAKEGRAILFTTDEILSHVYPGDSA